jgi:hypothetical protein
LADEELFREKASPRIEEFVRPYAGTAIQWAADILGVVLAAECGEEDVRERLMDSLERAPRERRPPLRGFLRDFRIRRHKRRVVYPGTGETLEAALPLLDGRTLRLPDDVRGKVAVIHFWSMACPPDPPKLPGRRIDLGDVTPAPNKRVIIGFNMDGSRSDVEKFLKNRYPGWLHVFSGKGRDDPLVRELDVYGLPRTLVLDREGRTVRWGTPGRVGGR